MFGWVMTVLLFVNQIGELDPADTTGVSGVRDAA
jgi:hypothetical protein